MTSIGRSTSTPPGSPARQEETPEGARRASTPPRDLQAPAPLRLRTEAGYVEGAPRPRAALPQSSGSVPALRPELSIASLWWQSGEASVERPPGTPAGSIRSLPSDTHSGPTMSFLTFGSAARGEPLPGSPSTVTASLNEADFDEVVSPSVHRPQARPAAPGFDLALLSEGRVRPLSSTVGRDFAATTRAEEHRPSVFRRFGSPPSVPRTDPPLDLGATLLATQRASATHAWVGNLTRSLPEPRRSALMAQASEIDRELQTTRRPPLPDVVRHGNSTVLMSLPLRHAGALAELIDLHRRRGD